MTVLCGFSLIPAHTHLCLKLQATAIGWLGQWGRLKSLSRGQTSIFIDMPLCLQCENIILDSRGREEKKSNMRISWLRLCLTNVPISYPTLNISFSYSKVFFFLLLSRGRSKIACSLSDGKVEQKKGGGCNWIKHLHISVIMMITASLEK